MHRRRRAASQLARTRCDGRGGWGEGATMNPMPAPEGDFISSLEPILLFLGGAMTISVGIFLFWLIRHTRAEDRKTRLEEERRSASGDRQEGEA